MTPKEKAKDLFDKYYNIDDFGYSRGKDGFLFWGTEVLEIQTKECALIAVNEILDASMPYFDELDDYVIFWQQVKREILAL